LRVFKEELHDSIKNKYPSFRALVKRTLRRFEERIDLIQPVDLARAVQGLNRHLPGSN